MVIFSKTEEKSYQSKHEKHHIFMTSTSKGEGGILKFVTNLQILLFFLNISIVHFFVDGAGGERHKIGHFCGRHKCMTSRWLKITTNWIIRSSSFFKGWRLFFYFINQNLCHILFLLFLLLQILQYMCVNTYPDVHF